jgi:hypothetical protein
MKPIRKDETQHHECKVNDMFRKKREQLDLAYSVHLNQAVDQKLPELMEGLGVADLMSEVEDLYKKQKKLPSLKDDDVTPKIVAGIDGLGRGQDLKKMNLFLQALPQIAQADPQSLRQVNFSGIVRNMINYLGLDPDGIIKSEQEMMMEQQQMQQAQQQASLEGAMAGGLEKSLPQVVKGAMDNPEMIAAATQGLQ